MPKHLKIGKIDDNCVGDRDFYQTMDYLIWTTHFIYKKLQSGPSTESFLAFGDLEYSKGS